jgi:hypothetical protein
LNDGPENGADKAEDASTPPDDATDTGNDGPNDSHIEVDQVTPSDDSRESHSDQQVIT